MKRAEYDMPRLRELKSVVKLEQIEGFSWFICVMVRRLGVGALISVEMRNFVCPFEIIV